MFSLGEKQRVLNTNADISFFDPAVGTARATTAAILSTDVFNIKGFGTFSIGDLVDIKLARAKAVALESKDYGVVAPVGVIIGDQIEVQITIQSTRFQSNVVNDYINGGKKIIFQTAALTGVTTTNISTAIVAAWTARVATFAKSEELINVTAAGAATDFRVLAATGYESVTVTKVEIRRSLQGAGTFPFTQKVVVLVNLLKSQLN